MAAINLPRPFRSSTTWSGLPSKSNLPTLFRLPCHGPVRSSRVAVSASNPTESIETRRTDVQDDVSRRENGAGAVLDSIEDAIEDIRNGKAVVVVDDESRENEGDLIFAASLSSPELVAMVLRHTSGLICCASSADRLEALQLPLMVAPDHNSDNHRTAFTVSVDYVGPSPNGSHLSFHSSFQSAKSRSLTLQAMADNSSLPSHFVRPGHIFPLKAKPGGVLERPGHTEAAVDLALLAGLPPLGALCEIVKPDGSMARLAELRQMASQYNLKLISIEDLARYIQGRGGVR